MLSRTNRLVVVRIESTKILYYHPTRIRDEVHISERESLFCIILGGGKVSLHGYVLKCGCSNFEFRVRWCVVCGTTGRREER